MNIALINLHLRSSANTSSMSNDTFLLYLHSSSWWECKEVFFISASKVRRIPREYDLIEQHGLVCCSSFPFVVYIREIAHFACMYTSLSWNNFRNILRDSYDLIEKFHERMIVCVYECLSFRYFVVLL